MTIDDDDRPTGAAMVASGVEALIDRLRDEGVAAGRSRADDLINAAETEARQRLAAAEAEAARLVADARAEAARTRDAAEDALRLAARDAVLDLKHTLTVRFAGEIGRLVSEQTTDLELVRRLIVTIAARAGEELAIADDAAMEVILPRDAVGLEELRRRPQELNDGELTRLVLAVTGDVLRAGVTLRAAADDRGGITVRLIGQGITLDLTDQAVAAVLMDHLQPRFRALLEGIVK